MDMNRLGDIGEDKNVGKFEVYRLFIDSYV